MPAKGSRSVVDATYTPSFAARVAALRKDGPDAIEAVAADIYQKPSNKKWTDVIVEVVLAEFKAKDENPYKDGKSPTEKAADYGSSAIRPKSPDKEMFPTGFYEDLGIAVGTNGDKICSRLDGTLRNA